MAKVKIFLDKDETQHDAEQALVKALNHHSSGDIHASHSFQDPAMIDVSKKMEDGYQRISQDMIREISEVLDQDYKNGN